MIAEKKIIAVVGATGLQGGGLVRAILEEGEKTGFRIRAITRDPSSSKAETLRQLGVEDIVRADINDEDSITKATEDAYGMFCVSQFWEAVMDPDKELQQARNMAHAAKRNGCKHVVWSTFEDSRRRLPIDTSLAMPSLGAGSRFKVPPCDAKGEADEFFEETGVPTTYLLTAFYWENFLGHMGPKRLSEGHLSLEMPIGPNKKLCGIAVEDIGRCALGIFERPDEYIGKRVAVVGETLTMREIAAKMAYSLGCEVAYKQIGFDDYRKHDGQAGVILGNMFQFFDACHEELAAVRSVEISRKLNPKMMAFSNWMEVNKSKFKTK